MSHKQIHPFDKRVAVFDLRVLLAGGEVAPLRPWVGDGAIWARSGIWASSASRHTQIERAQQFLV